MPPRTRIPLNTLAIAFGASGLAGAWSLAGDALDFSPLIADALWLLAAITWVWLIVAHAVRGARSSDRLATQLTHPVQGPIAAIVPIVGMLLGAELWESWPQGGVILVLASMAATAGYAAWILAVWMRGGITADSVHGGWLLPTVAGGYVASLSSAEVGLRELSITAFAIGSFFWVVMFVIVFVRMIVRPPLPGPLVPTLAILAAPPALAGRAFFDIAGHVASGIQLGIAGLCVLFLLVQVGLVPLYRRLAFSLGFWSFTFPLAAVGRYGIAWLVVTKPWGWQIWIDVILGVVTVVIVAIAVRSAQMFFRDRKSGRATGEQQLIVADKAAGGA